MTIFKSCHALIFFGVPNLGLRNEQLKLLVKDQDNENLVKDLVVDDDSRISPYLKSLNIRFLKSFQHKHLHIVSYFETRRSKTVKVAFSVPCLSDLVADASCSNLALGSGLGPARKY
jgi:hypothetical protein